ncbi:MAG: recombinase family protein [bacterium]|nr:recombinase family protein [bacterium]
MSTSDQEDQQTIENQAIDLIERIKADGLEIQPHLQFDDDGWTGTILRRPGLDKMLEAARAGEFNVLYVYDRGRLARDFVDGEVIVRELADYDVKLVTLHDPPSDTPEQKVMQMMSGVFHHYERVKILERTRRGRERKAKEKTLMSGQALYGYDRIAKIEETPAHWAINKYEQKVVFDIFDWFGRNSISINEIRQKLYDNGIRSKKGNTWWSTSVITRMLAQDVYITGKHYYNTSEACPPKKPMKQGYKRVKNSSKKPRPKEDWILEQQVPILLNRPGDMQLFKKVQKMLADNKKYARQRRRHQYLLSGFIYCECGKPRAGDGSSRHGHHYYRCTERIYLPKDKCVCAAMGVNADILDATFWKELTDFLSKPNLLREQAKQWLVNEAKRVSASDSKRNRILKDIKKIKETEERYQRAYGDHNMSYKQFEKLMRECRDKKAGLRKQLKELASKIDEQLGIDMSQLDELCREAKVTLQKLDFSNKRAIIRDLIDKITVYGQKQVDICGHIPLTTERLGSYVESRHRRTAQRR